VPAHLKDDVGTVIAAAFKLIKELPAYNRGIEKSAAYETAVANGDTAKINPVWTSVVKKVRTSTEEAFAEHPSLQKDLSE
jgi:glutathionylspermidine synthase